MERGVILNDGTPHKERVKAGLQWLISKGGGTVYIPLWRDYETYFDAKREKHQEELKRYGITVKKMERYMTPHGHILVLYPDEKQMRILEDCERDGDTMVVEWSSRQLEEWRSLFDISEYEVIR
jgi:hypothetical protein